jgi:hypothetical protein
MKQQAGIAIPFVLLLSVCAPLAAQNAALVGTVTDAQEAAIPDANVTLTSLETGVARSMKTNQAGIYEFSRVRPGNYSIKVEQPGFKTYVQSPIVLEVEQRARADVRLEVGEISTVVSVEAEELRVQVESASLGSVVAARNIAELPLNGRFFLDLAMIQPGTVAPSTNNRTFLAVPSGIGISGINASGTREDSTNYLFDGINISDMVQNQITFQPNIDMIQEFKVQTNAFSAEYGRNAGIIVNGISKTGSNSFHGTAYEFVRNEKFDAKNYFDRGDRPIPPFKRNVFGYSVGGPIVRNNTFFFTSYEGRRGREVASLNTLVLTDAQRAAVAHPVMRRLLELVPQANDSTGSRFVGSVPRRRTLNQFSGRADHNFSSRDFLFVTFISNRDERTEPTLQLNNLVGFGDTRPAKRYLLSIGETHVFSPTLTNEFRAGMNRVRIDFLQEFQAQPQDYGITSPSPVFPQIMVPGAFSFGGINNFPQGRGDTTFQYSDTLSWIHGRQSIKFGAEFRRFRNNNFNYGTGGLITFGTVAAFMAGTPTQAQETTAVPVTPGLRVTAVNGFIQDDVKLTPRLTLNLGLRWEYNGVPTEIHDRLSIYDFNQNRLTPAGNGVQPYERQFTNFGPRIGFAFDPTGRAKTVIRAGAGVYYDQPVTNIVTGLGSNPPFSSQVNNTSNIDITNPFATPPGTGSAVNAVDPRFKSGRVLSYNFNIQQEVFGTVLQAAYVGSQGRHLRIFGDFNQGIGGVRPITGFTSITLHESAASSNYNGVWLSAERRLSRGLTFNTSYTFSKSIDTNSVGSSNPQVQDFRNLKAERALSDFDARHRFVFSGVYLLPFRGEGGLMKRLVEGWSIAPIFSTQSGNPFSPLIPVVDTRGSLLAFNRPNLVPGQPLYVADPSPAQWLNKDAFSQQATGFGNAGRNILTAPGMFNLDFSLAKNTAITERVGLQFRAEVFNILNHPNFAQPVHQITSAQFGQITLTRAVRGDVSSSRQIQLGMKLIF